MIRTRSWLTALVSVLVISGCATTGRDFARPVASELSLGSTNRDDLISKFGPPRSENTSSFTLTPSEQEAKAGAQAETGLRTTLSYSFVSPAGEASEGVSPQRGANFYLWNGKLIGYRYTSSFKSDATAFPEGPIAGIQKNKTTEKEIVDAFGEPGGRAIYPYTRDRTGRMLLYYHFEWNKAKREYVVNELDVTIGQDGIVTDYRYNKQTKPITYNPPATVPYYVTTPATRR